MMLVWGCGHRAWRRLVVHNNGVSHGTQLTKTLLQAFRYTTSLSTTLHHPSQDMESKACWVVREETKVATETRIDYSRIPKVELHVHMDGACRLDTLMDLSQKYNCDYPHSNREEFKKLVMLLGPAESLEQFLKVFAVIDDILRTKESVERVAYEYCEDLKKQNVLYFEFRYSPTKHVMSPEDYIEGVTAGLERGERDFGVKSRQLLCFIRGQYDEAERLVNLALKYKCRGVAGVDIAGNELLPLDERQTKAFHKARANGLHITMHAGESGPPSNVRQAIEEFGATRIGHGYRVLEDESVYRLAREKHIHFEACLISSIYTNSQKSYDSHAVKKWVADNVSFSLSTDDPGVMGNSVNMEYETAAEKVGLSEQQIIKSVFDGVKASFLPDDEKRQLLRRVERGIRESTKL